MAASRDSLDSYNENPTKLQVEEFALATNQKVFITGYRRLQLGNVDGKLTFGYRKTDYERWTISEAAGGKFTIKSSSGELLRDANGKLALGAPVQPGRFSSMFFTTADISGGDDTHWTISPVTSGTDQLWNGKVLITSQYGRQLRDSDGHAELVRSKGKSEEWIIVKDYQPWTEDYEPWSLLLRACLIGSRQIFALLIAYWRVCEWNPHHFKIMMHCHRETFGLWAYPCEGTKVFARCFPLLAISISLVVTARFIFQSRIYYHLFMKGAILDFQNYVIWKDNAFRILVFCFVMGMMHFVIDLSHPPYLVNHIAKIANILTFAIPCVVFFLVFDNACQIENHLVTVSKVFEDDSNGARETLSSCKLYSEEQVRLKAAEVYKGLEESQFGVDSDLDGMLNHVITLAIPSRGAHFEQNEKLHNFTASLFRGLWPARLLLADHLDDDGSVAFRRSVRAFLWTFAAVHVFIVVLLISATFRELGDVLPGHTEWAAKVPGHDKFGTEVYAGRPYLNLGSGYCRDDSMQRPDCYWREWTDMKDVKPLGQNNYSFTNSSRPSSRMKRNVRTDGSAQQDWWIKTETDHASTERKKEIERRPKLFPPPSFLAQHSQHRAGRQWKNVGPTTEDEVEIGQLEDMIRKIPAWFDRDMKPWEEHRINACAKYCVSTCIGFAIDADFCTIYNKKPVEAPNGWTKGSEGADRDNSVRRTAYVVQTNSHESAACFSKVDLKGRPQDMVGVLVCLLHVGVILLIIQNAFKYMRHSEMNCCRA
jgi:hypothetical protein